MKKFIIPIALVVAAGAAATVLISTIANKPVVADIPNPPDELPSGNYYIDGDAANDNLYLVVDGKAIHFESSGDLREAFKAIDETIDPLYLTDKEALERQTDQTMADWGDESYTYTLRNWPNGNGDLMVYFKIDENAKENELAGGQGFIYHPGTKTMCAWAGDFVLAETE